MDKERPLLAFEIAEKTGRHEGLPRAPHCDSRILHHPDDNCDYCTEATELQAERERLGISNSGRANRKYPCPADQARSKAQYSKWGGNRPVTRAQLDEEAAKFRAELAKYMGDDGDPGDES